MTTVESREAEVTIKYGPFIYNGKCKTTLLDSISFMGKLISTRAHIKIYIPSASSVSDDSMMLEYYPPSRTWINSLEGLAKELDQFSHIIKEMNAARETY